ncbi:hypothetical protein ACFRMQ_09305 [Kitasatospora sp. NPDC056783]|uniref:hypothetical protein n=1 Tax=Kitasatospora sp. NPDC056783 TaxID=3345943 RepID=UPI0036A23926
MIAADIPLAIISKTLRHSTLAITINLYGHLLKDSAEQAVQALDHADTQAVRQTDFAAGHGFGQAA